MRVTARDRRIVRDHVASHVMSRDQVCSLYFGSYTRTNARLRGLCAVGLLRRLETPFFAQSLYVATPKAAEVVGERLAALAASRGDSPRFLQHALSVTNVRIALRDRGALQWRYEQQATTEFTHGGKSLEVRPDGVAVLPTGLLAVEVDLGHVALPKFRQKLDAYDAFVRSRACDRAWGSPTFSLLVVTTGKLRASRLARLVPQGCGYDMTVTPHDRLGIPFPGSWS